jgi:hypothetical protein
VSTLLDMADPPEEPPVRGGVPLSAWSGSGATDAMHETLKAFSEEAARQNATLVRLTRALVFLTVVLVVQIALAR